MTKQSRLYIDNKKKLAEKYDSTHVSAGVISPDWSAGSSSDSSYKTNTIYTTY